MESFVLEDPVTGKNLSVGVIAHGTFLNLHPEGYGNPISLDWYEGRLRILVNKDPNEEEPEIIHLEKYE